MTNAIPSLHTIDDAQVTGKVIAVRADLDVPGDKKTGAITNDRRLRDLRPTLTYLLQRKPRLIVVYGHRGRPEPLPVLEEAAKPSSQKSADRKAIFSNEMSATRLAEMLEVKVRFLPDLSQYHRMLARTCEDPIVVFENLRYDSRESSKDADERLALAEILADPEHVDLYVLEAMGTAHRAAASMLEAVKVAKNVALGINMGEDIEALNRIVQPSDKPLLTCVGGAKADKLKMVQSLAARSQRVFLAGGLAWPFLFNKKLPVGPYSIGSGHPLAITADQVEMAEQISAEYGDRIVLPLDMVSKSGSLVNLREGYAGSEDLLDIGAESVSLVTGLVQKAGRVAWNGPFGVTEMEQFQAGTRKTAQAIVNCGDRLESYICGGDTSTAMESLGFADGSFTRAFSAGGAVLSALEAGSTSEYPCMQSAAERS